MSTPILPFAKAAPPPPPVVVLLESAELRKKSRPSILALEDLSWPRKNVRHHPYRRPIETQSNDSSDESNSHSRAPTPQPVQHHDHAPSPQPMNFRPSTPPQSRQSTPPTTPCSSAESRETTPSSSTSISSSPPSQQSKRVSFSSEASKIRIERPKGAGRANLQKLVKWEPAYLNQVKKHARGLINKHLDGTLCFRDQDEAVVNHIKAEMVKRFTCLDDYENNWPADIIIMGLLKYSSSQGNKAKVAVTSRPDRTRK